MRNSNNVRDISLSFYYVDVSPTGYLLEGFTSANFASHVRERRIRVSVLWQDRQYTERYGRVAFVGLACIQVRTSSKRKRQCRCDSSLSLSRPAASPSLIPESDVTSGKCSSDLSASDFLQIPKTGGLHLVTLADLVCSLASSHLLSRNRSGRLRAAHQSKPHHLAPRYPSPGRHLQNPLPHDLHLLTPFVSYVSSPLRLSADSSSP